MKKFLAVLFILFLNISFAVAREKNYSIHFNGEKFDLLYSTKDKEFGGYLNEYYKHGETYNIWSEMVAVHHFPNAYSPIDRIRDFKDYLLGMKIPSSITFDDKTNTALIDFILITNDKMPIVLEFNIFKYEKSKKCGSIAVQYAKRYAATTTMQIEEVKKDFEKNRKKLIKKVEKFEIPTLVTKDVDKCISALDVKGTTKENISDEENKIVKTDSDAKNIDSEVETETAEPEVKKAENLEAENVEEEITSDTPATAETIAEEETQGNEDVSVVNNESADDVKNAESAENLNEVNSSDEISGQTELSKEEVVQEETNKEDTAIIKEEVKEEISITEQDKESISDKSALPDNNIEKNDEKDSQAEVKTKEIVLEKPAVNVSEGTKKKNKEKNVNYKITNNKNDLIAQPRSKNEIKSEVKEKRLDAKTKEKQAKKQAKSEKKTYVISNTNKDLIANPRNKKELKKQIKLKKKQTRERAKQAKLKLED